MRSTFNIGFVCRPSKVQKSGLAPVEMIIVINGIRTYLLLPRKQRTNGRNTCYYKTQIH